MSEDNLRIAFGKMEACDCRNVEIANMRVDWPAFLDVRSEILKHEIKAKQKAVSFSLSSLYGSLVSVAGMLSDLCPSKFLELLTQSNLQNLSVNLTTYFTACKRLWTIAHWDIDL